MDDTKDAADVDNREVVHGGRACLLRVGLALGVVDAGFVSFVYGVDGCGARFFAAIWRFVSSIANLSVHVRTCTASGCPWVIF